MKEKLAKLYLHSETAAQLYEQYAKPLPIIDYHCHLSPQEICENPVFDNIGSIWLAGDHYKWRLMRTYGIDEYYITGGASWFEKFQKYAEVIALSIGGPLYYWTHMELLYYFGIDEALTPESAQRIWDRANNTIQARQLAPRTLIEQSRVEYIGTTDDPCDDLHYHEKIAQDKSFSCRVCPSFRADPFLLITHPTFLSYIQRLRTVVGFDILSIDDYERAIALRLDHFQTHGARFADVGIEFFPNQIGSRQDADRVLRTALSGSIPETSDYHRFLGYLYCYLGKACKDRNIVLQMHIAVKRNPNTALYHSFGPDAGADCIGEAVDFRSIIALFDTMAQENSLPKTIIYALNPSMIYAIATIAGAFPDVHCGAAWWFNDHQRGIKEHLRIFAETGHLSRFYGMLTDSRSFLSYARHDYFRRILCQVFAEWIDHGEVLNTDSCIQLLRAICYENSKELVLE